MHSPSETENSSLWFHINTLQPNREVQFGLIIFVEHFKSVTFIVGLLFFVAILSRRI